MRENQENGRIDKLNLMYYDAVSKVKSIRRAIRRGKIAWNGLIAPDRPFNNRGNTSNRTNVHSRSMNEYKKYLYGQLKQHN